MTRKSYKNRAGRALGWVKAMATATAQHQAVQKIGMLGNRQFI